MVAVTILISIVGFLVAFAPAWFVWKKTIGRPVLRTISVTVAAVIGLLIFTVIREVTTEVGTRISVQSAGIDRKDQQTKRPSSNQSHSNWTGKQVTSPSYVTAYDQGDHANALRIALPLAEHGNSEAQYYVGLLYDLSETRSLFENTVSSVPENPVEAAKWYLKAANQGHAEAEYRIGLAYRMGSGVPRDVAEGMAWTLKAAEHGSTMAQLILGDAYRRGVSELPQSDTEAAKWYLRAAEQGSMSAQSTIGLMYAKGEGVLQDYNLAASWYRKAAEQGSGFSQGRLGLMYSKGQGLPQDYVQAHKWLNLAGAGLDSSSSQTRDEVVKERNLVEQKMTPTQVAEAQRLARDWKPNKAQK